MLSHTHTRTHTHTHARTHTHTHTRTTTPHTHTINHKHDCMKETLLETLYLKLIKHYQPCTHTAEFKLKVEMANMFNKTSVLGIWITITENRTYTDCGV